MFHTIRDYIHCLVGKIVSLLLFVIIFREYQSGNSVNISNHKYAAAILDVLCKTQNKYQIPVEFHRFRYAILRNCSLKFHHPIHGCKESNVAKFMHISSKLQA